VALCWSAQRACDSFGHLDGRVRLHSGTLFECAVHARDAFGHLDGRRRRARADADRVRYGRTTAAAARM
jgi:CO/xanthine dehydrogenase Mo-binding subunit